MTMPWEREEKKEVDPWNSLPRDVALKIMEFLDPASKLNLMLCSRRTYNKIKGSCEYFHKVIFELEECRDENDKCYSIEMFYENEERRRPDNYITIDEAFLYLNHSDSEDMDDEETSEDREYRAVKTFVTRVIKRGEAYPGKCYSNTDEEGSGSEVAYRIFDELIQQNHKNLGYIEIGANVLEEMEMFHDNFNFDSFPRLENLILRSEDSFSTFLPKLPIGCKNVKLIADEDEFFENHDRSIRGCSESRYVMSLPQIRSTTGYLSLKDIDVHFKELIDLKADKAKMLLRSMKDEGLNAFVKLWIRGRLPNNIVSREFIHARQRKIIVETVLKDVKAVQWDTTNFEVPEVSRHEINTHKVFRTKSKVYENRYMDIIFGPTDVTLLVR